MADVEFEPHEAEWWVEAGLERERWERERREGKALGRAGAVRWREGEGEWRGFHGCCGLCGLWFLMYVKWVRARRCGLGDQT